MVSGETQKTLQVLWQKVAYGMDLRVFDNVRRWLDFLQAYLRQPWPYSTAAQLPNSLQAF